MINHIGIGEVKEYPALMICGKTCKRPQRLRLPLACARCLKLAIYRLGGML